MSNPPTNPEAPCNVCCQAVPRAEDRKDGSKCNLTEAVIAEKANKIEELVAAYQEVEDFSGAVLVAEKGRIIYKHAFGLANLSDGTPNTADTMFRIGSITKTFTAVVIMQLVEKGALTLDGAINDYLPDYPEEQGRRVTIHHMLSHTSGIPNFTAAGNIREWKVLHFETNELMRKFSTLPLEFEPGARFNYSNSNYYILGAIIERVAGKPYGVELRENVFAPSEMTNSSFDDPEILSRILTRSYYRTFVGYQDAPPADPSVPFAAGGIYSTVGDLYKFTQALSANRLLSEKNKKLMNTPVSQVAQDFAYGYGCSLLKKTFIQVSHYGQVDGFVSFLGWSENGENAIIILSNNSLPQSAAYQIPDEIQNIAADKPCQLPERIKEVTKATLDSQQALCQFLLAALHDIRSLGDQETIKKTARIIQFIEKETGVSSQKTVTEYYYGELPARQMIAEFRERTSPKTKTDLIALRVALSSVEKDNIKNADILTLLNNCLGALNTYAVGHFQMKVAKYHRAYILTRKDYDEASAEMLAKMIGIEEINIAIGENEEKTFAALERFDPEGKADDVICFIDEELFGKEGLEIAKKIKKRNSKFPIMIIKSKNSNPVFIEQSIADGIVNDVIIAPYDVGQIQLVVNSQIVPVCV